MENSCFNYWEEGTRCAVCVSGGCGRSPSMEEEGNPESVDLVWLVEIQERQ